METWKTLKKRAILSFGKWLSIERHTVELPDGSVIDDWPWVITPDYINVIAITKEDMLLFFRQVKYAIPGESLAPVGGYIEPGEDPLAAAKRELLEETGYTSDRWSFLGRYTVDANRGAGAGYFYLAHGAEPTSKPDTDDLEEQELLLLERAETTEALRKGRFKALPWAAIVALALLVDEVNAG